MMSIIGIPKKLHLAKNGAPKRSIYELITRLVKDNDLWSEITVGKREDTDEEADFGDLNKNALTSSQE